MTNLLRLLLTMGALTVAACENDVVGAGGHCDTSAQCAAGLLCDITKKPAVCATMGSPVPDLASVSVGPNVDLSGVLVEDMAGADMSAVQVLDLAMVEHPDLAKHD